MYNINSADSIIDFAKLLKDQTLKEACGVESDERISLEYDYSEKVIRKFKT